MTAEERVLAACAFQRPDRIPRFYPFWEFPESWRARLGSEEDLNDVAIWCPDEGTFPTRSRVLKQDGTWIYEVDSWGRTLRRKPDAYFYEVIEVPLAEARDVDRIVFDPPNLDVRFLQDKPGAAEMLAALRDARERLCVFGKTGGPYLRSTFVRGEEQFLMDIAADPELAKTIADKVGDHLTAVGVEELRRWGLGDTGIWIYDDMAFNRGPMFSPESFERIFLPAYRRMIAAYKQAGARYVILHSDGDIRSILDMLVDAGIDGLNPLERRANMHPGPLRRQYPHLILTGGMCNSTTLINGPIAKIEAEAREVIDLGRDGGVIIGTHSLSPEVPLDHFAAYNRICLEYGDFAAAPRDQ